MIYIGTDEGIYRWVEKTFWPAYHCLQDRAIVSLASPGAGLLAVVDNTGRVFESDDNGVDWVEIPLPENAGRAVAVGFGGAAGSILLTTRPMGLLQRTIGAPFTVASSWPRAERLFDMAADAIAVATLSKRKKAEAAIVPAWRTLTVPSVSTQGVAPSIRSLVLGRGESPAWFAAVSGAGLWRSEDTGKTWEQCPSLPAEVYAIRTTAKAGTVAVATSNGCWLSTDGGRTWEDRSGGLDTVRHLRAIEIHPEDPDIMLAGAAPADRKNLPRGGTQFALYESSDAGKTWSKVRRGFPEVLEYDTISDIRFDPAAPANAIVALDSGELWRTYNGGDWWEPIARQIRAARVLCAVR